MFGFFEKSGDRERDESLSAWEQSPTVPIHAPTNRKTKFLLEHIGQAVVIRYHGELRTITPLYLFRKPHYGRSYVEAEHEGQSKSFNLDDISIPKATSAPPPSPPPKPSAPFAPIGRPLPAVTGETHETTAAAGCLTLSILGVMFAMCCGVGGWCMGIGSNGTIAEPGKTVKSSPSSSEVEPSRPSQTPIRPATPAEKEPTNSESSAVATSPATKTPGQVDDSPPNVEPKAITLASESTFGRKFTSTAGTTTRAEFVEFRFQGSRVVLKKEDGSLIDVSMNQLSKEDQQWIRDELKRRKSS